MKKIYILKNQNKINKSVKNKLIKLNNKGMGLIEVIAALGIATMVVTSLVSLSIFSLRSSLKSKLLLESSKVANRELELLRSYRDRNTWTDFLTSMQACVPPANPKVPVCNMDLNGSLINEGIDPTNNLQDLAIDQVGRGFYAEQQDDIVQITVVAYWKEGNTIKNTTLRTDLTNWQQR